MGDEGAKVWVDGRLPRMSQLHFSLSKAFEKILLVPEQFPRLYVPRMFLK